MKMKVKVKVIRENMLEIDAYLVKKQEEFL